ncbi:MAG: hypothetical protein V3T53_14885 [Phycisphaerales bacterium]
MGATGLVALAMLVLIAWLTGRIVSDRYGWSQWLLWIPTPGAILAALLGFLGALRPVDKPHRRRRRLLVWGIIALALVGYFTLREHRILRRPPSLTTGMRIAYWNPNSAAIRDSAEVRNTILIDLDADLTILANAGGFKRYDALADTLGLEGKAFRVRPFLFFTRLPLLEYQTLISNGGIEVVHLRLDATATLGRAISIYAVDIPSNPRWPRLKTARYLRRLLDSVAAPPPDIVIGDLNMTRGGAALRAAFPDLEHAYDQAGHGYGATYPRVFPLYHIDHVLLAESLQAADYQLVNPGVGRHVIQVTDVRPRNMP